MATAPLVLSSGSTYWLTSEEYDPDTTGAVWRGNNTGINTANAIRINTSPWSLAAQSTPAFRINGDPISAVPEPSSLVLGAVAVGGCLLARWRKNRKAAAT